MARRCTGRWERLTPLSDVVSVAVLRRSGQPEIPRLPVSGRAANPCLVSVLFQWARGADPSTWGGMPINGIPPRFAPVWGSFSLSRIAGYCRVFVAAEGSANACGGITLPDIIEDYQAPSVEYHLTIGSGKMTMPTGRSAEETGRLGDEIYERDIRRLVEAEHHGEVIAIDVDSGDYAIAATASLAARHLREQRPDAGVWLMRVGYRTLRHFGGSSLRRNG